jgi:hypothetical protein
MVCTKKIKSVRRNLYELLYFDPQFSDTNGDYPLINDAETQGYAANIDFLQDKLMYYYYKRDRELEMGALKVYDYDDTESELIQFALESLIEYLQRNTEDRLDYSVKILGDTVSTVITAHIYD